MTTPGALTKLFDITHPIIQGPFGGGLSSIALLATVSNAGGLGSFGAHYLAPEHIVPLARDIRRQSDRPFNLNLWVTTYDEAGKSLTQAQFEAMSAAFKPHYDALGLALPARPDVLYPDFEQQAEAVIEAAPRVFSFVYGVPSADIIERCKSKGIMTVGTATTLAEAIALENGGVDAIVATGFEAGGHRVSFLKEPEDSLTGSLSLIPQIVDAVKVPVIAAGGIADVRGIRAAVALGASGVQIGTAFLACDESGTSALHREVLFSPQAHETVLTRAFTGRLARFVPNHFIAQMQRHDALPAPFPLQSFFVGALKQAALKSENSDYSSLYSSQSAALLKHRKAAALFGELAGAFTH